MDPKTLKIIFIVVAFIEALAIGVIPVYSTRFKESPKVLGIANAFSGGVFVAIALMHIMPEQVGSYATIVRGDPECQPRLTNNTLSTCGDNDDFDACRSSDEGCFWNPNPNDVDEYFPMPFFILVIGYTAMLVIDKVLFDTHMILGDHSEKDATELDEKADNSPDTKFLKAYK